MKYKGPERREHVCPIDNCNEVQRLVLENSNLNQRLKTVSIVSLTILTLVCTVILAMSKYTMDIAKESNRQLAIFVEKHNDIMIRDENIHSTLVSQMSQVQLRLDKTTDIQREVIQEVAILKKGRVR